MKVSAVMEACHSVIVLSNIRMGFICVSGKANVTEKVGQGVSLLLQDVPRYPGAHTHVPSSGEQDPPF